MGRLVAEILHTKVGRSRVSFVASRSFLIWSFLVVFVLGGLCASAESCPECGSVSGSVAVARATIRTEGPKHDRDVVVVLKQRGESSSTLCVDRTEMDQQGLVFIPHVLAIQKGTTVTFLNNDNEQHNVYFLNDRTGATLDIGTWGKGISVDHRFLEAGTIITLCKLHLEMAAYIVVVEDPWFEIVQLDPSTMLAEFSIDGVPTGVYDLEVWHKKLKQKGGSVAVEVRPGAVAEVQIEVTKAKYARGK